MFLAIFGLYGDGNIERPLFDSSGNGNSARLHPWRSCAASHMRARAPARIMQLRTYLAGSQRLQREA